MHAFRLQLAICWSGFCYLGHLSSDIVNSKPEIYHFLFLTFSGEIVISNLLWSWGVFYSVVSFLNITSISKIKFDASSLNIFLTSLPFVLPSRSAGLTSFPDYLVLHMRKFVMEAGWVPKKLGISLGFLSFFYIDIEILYVSQCLCICLQMSI